MTKKSKIIVTIALMLGISLASLDTTIVGTAMPTIVGKLGGITLYSWVFSAYLLTSTTTVPIYGKLADLFGRKPIFLFGSMVFLIGSAASGASQSMEQLILFRAIQGLGAGAVLPIVLTIIGDIFALEERARVQGLFSGVWAMSSIVGPALGGLIVDHFSWRWVFYINLPFGLLSALLLTLYFHEKVERKKVSLDYIGTLTLSGGVVALLFALLQGGTNWAWNSLPSIACFALSALLLGLFIVQEKRVQEPILPLTLFKNRIIAISNIGGFILGVILFGITSYVPLFVQGVKGGTAISAGVTLGPLLIAWPISSTLSGRVIIRFGYRFTAVMGALFAAIGMGMVTLFRIDTGLPFIVAAMLITGTGLGFMSTSFVIAVQNAVPWNLRGVATASTQFVRTMGGTIGVALMGTVLNAQMTLSFAPIFAHYADVLARLPKGLAPSNVLLTPDVRSTLPSNLLTQLQLALAQGLFWVYALMFMCALIGLAAMFFLPGGNAEQYSYKNKKRENGQIEQAEFEPEISSIG
ncbi:MAG TPA: MDR family MFS transporter [Ktedonobacteraceae bacterium]|nr:MDR family MFS transporter [Ktedonobacteraceae bacterium]